ncbi:MAG: Hemagluttinin family protein [Candidatus Nomurabacteria bacterium GW2011_GWF2_40_31]|nr:MAG: Hemagluttinin family protein [Candidatus Nomurabacteria bacterium GW2011_GWF2_40_31]
MASKICIKRLLLWKFIFRYFILAFFLFPTIFPLFPQPALAATSSDSLMKDFQAYMEPASAPQVAVDQSDLFSAFKSYVAEPKPEAVAVNISQSELFSAYKSYVATTPLNNPPPSQGGEVSSPPPSAPASQGDGETAVMVNQIELFKAFRNYVAQVLPPVIEKLSSPDTGQIASNYDPSLLSTLQTLLKKPEFLSLLRGPKGLQGEQGAEGPQGLPAPSSLNNVQGPVGYNFGTTAPSAPQNNPIGTLGGFTALGAQDLTSTILHVTGTSTLNNVTVSGNASIATLAVTGTSTLAGGIVFNGTTDFDIDDNTASALTISEGSNNYLNVTTTNSSENISLGNTTTNPTVNFLGTGLITLAGAGAETATLTLTTGSVTLTDGDLTISSGEIAATSDDATGTAFSFTGVSTTGTVLGVTANSLTSGSASNITSSNNSAANTAWSANQLNVTNAQGTTAVSTGSIAGLDVQFTQNTSVAGNTETAGRVAVKQNDSSSTDAAVASILSLENNDTATGNQIVATDGLKITAGTASNITNGINLSGTFATNYITSSNFVVSNAGAITGVGVNSGTGLIQGTGGITVTGTGNINATGTAATNIGNSTGALVIASGGTSSWNNTSGNLTIQTATSGTMTVDSAGILNLGTTNSTATNLGKAATTLTINPTAWTATPTISGLITATSGITSNGTMTVAAGFTQTGANTFSTGTGAISLNGATTVTGSNTFATGTGATTINSTSVVLAGNSAILDMTGTGTLGINTTTNRAVTFGSGTVTIPTLTASSSITNSALTAGRVTFAGTAGLLVDDADMTFATDTLTVTKFGATTLTGTISGGGQQLNNVIIGTTTPLAGAFTTLTSSGLTTVTNTTASTSSTTGALVVSGGVGIASASTTASSMGLNVAHTGAITGTGYAGYFSKTGASTTNVGLYATATGATNNYAAIFEAGNVGIGTTTPGQKLDIEGSIECGIAGSNDCSIISPKGIMLDTGGSSEPITFVTDTEKVRITGGGNVGIGTTGPVGKLDIITGAVTAVGALASSGIHIGEAGDVNRIAEISLGWSNGGANTNAPASLGFITTSATGQTKGALYFATRDVTTDTAPTERMRIQSNGNVGIGTTGPGTQLDIVNDGGVADGIRVGNNRTNTNSEEDLGLIWGDNNTSSNDIYIGGGTSSFNAATSINFYTAANSTTVTGTNRMVIDSGGNVGIGTTVPGAMLDVNRGDANYDLYQNGALNLRGGIGEHFGFGIDSDLGSLGGAWISAQQAGVGALNLLLQPEGGNVGIGTTGPDGPLHVFKASAGTITANSIADELVVETNVQGGISILTPNSVAGVLAWGDPEDNLAALMQYRHDVTRLEISTHEANGSIQFATGAESVAMTINSGGNVGIGDASPDYKLELSVAAGSDLAFGISDGDVAHGFTDNFQADTFLHFGPISSEQGAGIITGLSDAVGRQGLVLRGLIGNTDPTDTVPAVEFRAGKLSAATLGDLGAAETAFQFNDSDANTSFLTILGNGNVGIGEAGPETLLQVTGAPISEGTILGQVLVKSAAAYNASPQAGIIFKNRYNAAADSAYMGSIRVGKTTTGDGNYGGFMAFDTRTHGSVGAERMRIDTDGNVGIGTTGPNQKLVVGDDMGVITGENAIVVGSANGGTLLLGTSATAWSLINYNNANSSLDLGVRGAQQIMSLKSGNVGIGTTGPQGLLHLYKNGGDADYVIGTNTSGDARIILDTDNGIADGTNYWFMKNDRTSQDLRFWYGGNNLVTFQDGGNVGIGTTEPSELLHIESSSANQPVLRVENTNADANPPRLDLVKDSASPAAGDELGRIYFIGDDSIGTEHAFAGILGISNVVTDGSEEGHLAFLTRNGATFGEGMRITSSGNVGIGTTGPNHKLHVAWTSGSQGAAYFSTNDWNNTNTGSMFRIRHGAASGDTYSELQAFSVGGTAANSLVLQPDGGNVGIGTTNPSQSLETAGSIQVTGGGCIYYGATSQGSLCRNDSTAELTLATQNNAAADLIFSLGNSGAHFEFNNGNVGIGTTGPDRVTEINSATGINLRLTYNDSNGSATNYADLLTTSAGLLQIIPSGNAMEIGGGTTATEMRFMEPSASGTNYSAFKAIAQAASITYSLPPAVGGAGTQLTDVAGDGVLTWAAAGSLRSMKNIVGTITDPNEALTQILSTPIYQFHYKPKMGTGDSATMYVGVMADEAPWAMHYGGNIINPVNTLGYMVLGLQATNKKIDELDLKIDGVEERVVTLEANAIGAGQVSDSLSTALFDAIMLKLEDVYGVVWENGVMKIANIITDTITSKKVVTEELQMKDSETGEIYCVTIKNGELDKTQGVCAPASEVASAPAAGSGESAAGAGNVGTGDTVPPVITLTGEAIINLNVGESYNELGVTATDETDGDVAVIISGSVDTSTAGSYEIKYNRTVNIGAGAPASEEPATPAAGSPEPPPESEPEAPAPEPEPTP